MNAIIIKKHKPNPAVLVRKSLGYTFMAVLAIFFIVPFFLMVCYSILPDKEALRNVLFSPSNTLYLGTYIKIFTSTRYLGYLKNSVIVGLISAIVIPVSSSLCAYGFTKMIFKGRDTMFGVMMATLMVPSIVTQIPLYVIYIKLGWAESLYPLWVPALFGGGATNIFLMCQFMRGIPNDISSAARIDGANSFLIYYRIIMPLCGPIFLYVMVMAFIGSWNDFMTPLMYITDPTKYTLSLGIYRDYGGAINIDNPPNHAMAAGFVMAIPCMILFFAFQRFLIDGVAITGLKG